MRHILALSGESTGPLCFFVSEHCLHVPLVSAVSSLFLRLPRLTSWDDLLLQDFAISTDLIPTPRSNRTIQFEQINGSFDVFGLESTGLATGDPMGLFLAGSPRFLLAIELLSPLPTLQRVAPTATPAYIYLDRALTFST